MKINIKIKTLMLFGAFFILATVSGCTTGNQAEHSSIVLGKDNTQASTTTNEVSVIQSELPFTIVLPRYLPLELESSKPKIIKRSPLEENQIADIFIEYYSSTNLQQIHITETLLKASLPEGVSVGMNPDYTPIKLSGAQVLENSSFDYISSSGQKIQVSESRYMWDQNNLHFTCIINGYDQMKARKIVESMIN